MAGVAATAEVLGIVRAAGAAREDVVDVGRPLAAVDAAGLKGEVRGADPAPDGVVAAGGSGRSTTVAGTATRGAARAEGESTAVQAGQHDRDHRGDRLPLAQPLDHGDVCRSRRLSRRVD